MWLKSLGGISTRSRFADFFFKKRWDRRYNAGRQGSRYRLAIDRGGVVIQLSPNLACNWC